MEAATEKILPILEEDNERRGEEEEEIGSGPELPLFLFKLLMALFRRIVVLVFVMRIGSAIATLGARITWPRGGSHGSLAHPTSNIFAPENG